MMFLEIEDIEEIKESRTSNRGNEESEKSANREERREEEYFISGSAVEEPVKTPGDVSMCRASPVEGT